MHPTSVLSTLALAVPLAFAAPFPSARIPLLGYSSPEPFLGLEAAELAKPIGTVAFIPRFHPCGTLLVLSVDDLSFDDLALLPHSASNASLWALYDSAPTNLLQDDAVEGTALAWMRGWRSTCGKGEHNREVRVASLTVDGADRSDKAAWARSLDEHAQPHLASLPPAPHNAVVLLTSLSPSSLRTAFDLATPPPRGGAPAPPGGGPPRQDLPPRRRRPHGLVLRTLGHMVDLALAGAFLVALSCAARWAWRVSEARRRAGWGLSAGGAGGGVSLPLDREGARELEMELDSDEEEEGDAGRRGH
ncbi:hypothetical protein DMC30DRAFT_268418 [Rhodotorula diobovata]|uniref:Protein BIG1 n=1 Tax=Rhodotorula diobovata TaxID=5288 RepID=A0A5C5FVW2_9BASI|nr:hypothetical protein DMC30DRAFT_268418 [Rhodotorula diobovata]